MKQEILEPSMRLTYQGRDFTASVEKSLRCLTFVDVMEGESDSLNVELEDTDRFWQGPWYPRHGESITAEIFYAKGHLAGPVLYCGELEIDEAELEGPPDIIQIKALGAGVKRKLRSRQGKAYEETTLAAIAGEVAGRNGLELVGEIEDIKIARVTQVYESDLPFLKRLADEYGHGMNVKRGQLRVFKRVVVKAQGPLRTVRRTEVETYHFKDKISTIVESATVTYHDPLMKDIYVGATKDDEDGKKKRHGTDELKINIRAETPEQAQIKADSALDKANEDQTTCTLTLMGEAWQEAGINIMLDGWFSLDGKYQVDKATHTVIRGNGWGCTLEMKRIRE
ncbi:MAG: contractile injection system protein, VgrG/Pvc8 family [Burkholderiaceae bacterium]|nr:contractile injection system protein, VgrG/Pvc8 family [Burkholderiaceae bacterium]